MNINLVEMAKGYLSPEVVKNGASFLGETPEATSRGLNAAIPAVLGGFVKSAMHDPSGASISRILGEGQSEGASVEELSTFSAGGSRTDAILGKGHGMLTSLFGEKLSGAVDWLAGSAGVSRMSAGKILSLAAPLVGAVVGREARANKLGPSGVASMLADQKGAVGSALGVGGLTSLFGGVGGWLDEIRATAHSRVEQISTRARTAASPEALRRGGRNNLPLLLLAALAVLAFLLWFGRRKPNVSTSDVRREVPRAELPPAPTQAPARPTAAELPTAGPPAQPAVPAIGGGPTAATNELEAFFADNGESVPKRIDLQGLKFDHDSARLSDEGNKMLDSVAATLKAHPTSKMRIEGFTDDTGSAAHNQILSSRRAIAVRDSLVGHGVDASRITTAGYGSANPLQPNETEQGRAANRRIELVMTGR